MIDAVSETTRLNFNEVFEMSVLDFFLFLNYTDEKRRRENAEIERFRNSRKR